GEKGSSTQDFEIVSNKDSSTWSQISHRDAMLSQPGNKTVSSMDSWVEVKTDQSSSLIPENNSSIKGEQEIQEWAQEVHKPTFWETNPGAAFEPSRHGHIMGDKKGIHPSMYDRIHHNMQTWDLTN